MQAMPVLDAILAGKPMHKLISRTIVDSSFPDDLMAKTILVKCDEAAELYWSDTEGKLNPRHDFGPLRLPAPSVWVEYKNPKRGFGGDKKWGNMSRSNWAIHLMEERLPDDTFRVNAFAYMLHPEGVVLNSEVGETITVNASGRLVDGQGASMLVLSGNLPQHVRERAIEERGIESLQEEGHRVRIGLIAVGLMNCKNVSTEETDKGGPRRKKSRGKKFPRMTYRTINIPGYRGARTSSPSSDEDPSVAIHRVRGHFKTFTAEKPLMGRHVGTYWWGWQVRGSAKNGAVVSDYKVTKTAA